MNAVLQAMTHIPILRDFFLSQRHRREHCSFVHGRPEDAGSVCMSCQMDRIFEEMYCGKNTPFPPHHFLNAMWKHADHLAGYQQHDAHELFVSLLDGIHSSSGGSVKDCLCIIHSSFGGQLQSVVKCLTCDSRSSTIEMFLDLSLQIKHYSVASNGLAIPSMNRSLKECLLMYFHEEILSGNNKFFCQTCKEPRVSSKRFWIDHIPPVLCFHLKRFEHHYLNPKLGSKIDTLVSFPLEFLDMSEFMHSGRSPLYRLLGLIVHTGNLHHGHYFVYLRIENCWFCCDDTWIYPVFEHQVPLSQAYMLFYARDDLEHLPLAHT